MKILTQLAIMLFIAVNSYAGKGTTISGQVLDNVNKKSVEYSSVSINAEDGTIVNGTITNADGHYTITDIINGRYTLTVSFIGYDDYSQELIVNNEKVIEIKSIYLNPSIEQLSEIELIAEKSTYVNTLDKKIVNVGKDLVTAGPTADELMKNIPSMSTDQDGKLSMRGSTNIKILVNGRPSSLPNDQLLKQIPSNTIDRVEIITNPSAKYSPESEAGIINIILKKNNMEGMNVNLYSAAHNYLDDDLLGAYKLGFDFNYKVNKINMFVNYNHWTWMNRNSWEQVQENYHESLTEVATSNSGSERQVEGDWFKTGFDYDISKNDFITFYTAHNFSDESRNKSTDFVSETSQGDDLYRNNSKNNGKLTDHNQEYDVNYKHQFNGNMQHYLEADVYYGEYSSDLKDKYSRELSGVVNPGFLPYQVDNTKRTNKQFIASFDYSNTNELGTKLEIGTRYEVRSNMEDYVFAENIDREQEIIDPDPTNKFDYNENILALYSTYGRKINTWGVQLGLRAEYSTISGELESVQQNSGNVVEQNYFNLFPSLHITKSFGEDADKNINFSYSKRIQRPYYWLVNPIIKPNENIVNVGNPDIKPQTTHSLEIGFSKNSEKYNVSTSVYYRTSLDAWMLSIENAQTHTIFTRRNGAKKQNLGYEVSGMYSISEWWRINANANIYYSKIVGNDYTQSNEGVSYDASIMNAFKIYKTWNLSLNSFYRGPYYFPQGHAMPTYFFNLGARKAFLDDKLNVSMNFNDVFDTNKSTYYIESEELKIDRSSQWNVRRISVNISYRFGDMKAKNRHIKGKPGNEGSGGSSL